VRVTASPAIGGLIRHASAVSEGSMGFFQAGRKSVLLAPIKAS
jgi:hypothetical protein